ncbi:hypothetical protein, partial [Lactococcus petauri]
IGQNPFDWAKKFLKNDKFLLKKEYKIFCIPHYSGANNGGINSKANELGVENYYPTVVKTLLEKFRSEL